MRRWLSLVLGTCAILAALATRGAGQEPARSPDGAVMQLSVIGEERGQWRQYISGTAFFTSHDGTALTNSHVVYHALKYRDRHKILAILDGVFFNADLICASRLSLDPTDPRVTTTPLERDVAVIRVRAPDVPFAEWGVQASGGEFVTIARRHEGPLPVFTPLSIAGDPRPGETVRVIGFGRISALPRRWSAQGTVMEFEIAQDGTRVFLVQYPTPPQPGNSGSPVLNAAGQAVGLWTWYLQSDPARGVAIAASALRPPCR